MNKYKYNYRSLSSEISEDYDKNTESSSVLVSSLTSSSKSDYVYSTTTLGSSAIPTFFYTLSRSFLSTT